MQKNENFPNFPGKATAKVFLPLSGKTPSKFVFSGSNYVRKS